MPNFKNLNDEETEHEFLQQGATARTAVRGIFGDILISLLLWLSLRLSYVAVFQTQRLLKHTHTLRTTLEELSGTRISTFSALEFKELQKFFYHVVVPENSMRLFRRTSLTCGKI